jgi:hypothetical protein
LDRNHSGKIILEVTRRTENPKPNTLPSNNKKNLKDTLFTHFQIHKNGIFLQQIRAEFEKCLVLSAKMNCVLLGS